MDVNPSTTTSSSEEIGLELSALKQRIRDLHFQLNARAPISRFPAEVVTEIFSLVQQSSGDIFSPRFHSKSFVGWIKVTHVSQNWRQIALSSRKLWSIIPISKVRYARAALRRSGSALLAIVTYAPFELKGDDKALWQHILTLSPRIRLLQLGSQSRIKDLDKPLPLLEHLSFDGGTEIPRALLATPLKRLYLDSCNFTWDHLALNNLTHLKVTNPKEKIPLDAFILLLRDTPMLTTLDICSIFPDAKASLQDPVLREVLGPLLPHPSPYLPALSTFRASGADSCAYILLLLQLRFKPTFDLNLTYSPPIIDDRDLVVILQILNRILTGSSMTIRSVKLVAGVSYRPASCVFYADPRLETSFMNFSMGLPTNNQDMHRWFSQLAPFPLDEVEVLSTNGIVTESGWAGNAFSELSSLRRLQILDHGAAFLDFLASDSSSDSRCVSFPALEELEIHDVRFTRELKSTVPSCLFDRQICHARLRELIFVGGKITDAALRKLAVGVDKVRRVSVDEYLDQQRRR